MIRTLPIVGLCFLSISCGMPGPLGKVPKSRPAPAAAAQETPAWSLATLRQGGFKAESTVTVTIERGDSPVEITDHSLIQMDGDGDFSFRRNRLHKGSSDGTSDESVSAVRVDGAYYTAGSSGQWVRWDDALDQPDAIIDSFIANEDRLLGIVMGCGRLGAADGNGHIQVTGPVDACPFETDDRLASNKRPSGNVKSITGYLQRNGNTPVVVAVDLDVVSSIEGVEASVKLKYVLNVSSGPDGSGIVAPLDFLDSRRPRPVRMVDSVLSDIVDEWGPGAPSVLRKRAAGSANDRD